MTPKIPWRWEKALHILNLLNQRCFVEDSITYCRILEIFIEARELEKGKRVHGHMIKIGFEPDVCLAAKLVSMYAKFGCIEDAHQMFDKMHAHNLVSWTSMIEGYAQHCYGGKDWVLFCLMMEEGKRMNQFTIVNILRACASFK